MKRQHTCARILALLLLAGGLPLQAQPQPAETNLHTGAPAAMPSFLLQAQPQPAETNLSGETGPGSILATNAGAATNSTVEAVREQPLNDAAEDRPRPNAAGAKPAARPASADKSGFSPFQIIADRNIFNGNRSGQRITSTRITSQQRSVRVDAFSLVGTMVSEKGPVAFFDGTESDFRKAFKAGGRIGGFEIREVRYAGVRLAQGTNTFDLAVSTGMRREDGGLWKPTSGGPSFASDSSSRSSARSDSTSRNSGGSSRDRSAAGTTAIPTSMSGGSAPSSADTDAILRRMMEKREKE